MKVTPPKKPRLEPCSEVNPVLWHYFCQLKDRPAEAHSDVWTEYDVVQMLISMCSKDLQDAKKKNG